MLTKTTELAIQTLIHLVICEGGQPRSPRSIADELDLSPTYLAKVANQLVKGGILRAHRGALGGMTLARPASEVTLLEIVEACQGRVVGNYCEASMESIDGACAFHRAMLEMHQAMIEILSRWTLADLAARPPAGHRRSQFCRLGNVCPLGDDQ